MQESVPELDVLPTKRLDLASTKPTVEAERGRHAREEPRRIRAGDPEHGDALQNAALLTVRGSSSAEVLRLFAERLAHVERSYERAIRTVVQTGTKTGVCTVYNGALEPARVTVARLGLALFNDAILRTAIELRLDVIELRNVCTEAADYANPIAPSGHGGHKIAMAIAKAAGALDGATPSRVWGSTGDSTGE